MRLIVLLIGVVVPAAWICAGRGHSSQAPVAARAPANSKFQFQGAGSCASMACHNADGDGYRSREYRIALERDFSANTLHSKDKHAQAYAVLFEERSLRILRHLKPADTNAHPTHERQCLVCHVHPDYERQQPWMHAEGVSCEACHGPAERWLTAHFRPEMKGLSAEVRHRDYGMNDTRSLVGRARMCVVCHIGTKDSDVNHDLIAAGHPRLNFEFSSFQHDWHKHWDIRKDKDPACDPRGRKDFEARSWAIGQIVSAEAALRLLADRAAGGAKRPWVEFAEFNCFACHHDLTAKNWRQEGFVKGKSGKLTWSPWYYTLLDEALSALGINAADADVVNVQAQLDGLARNLESLQTSQAARTETAKLAEQAAKSLKALLDSAPQPAGLLPVRELLKTNLDRADLKKSPSWDHTAPRLAALTALARAQGDLGQPAPNLGEFSEALRFPLGFDSPRGYDPGRLEKALGNLKQANR